MKKTFALTILFLATAAHAWAQGHSFEVIGRYVRIDPQGSTTSGDPSSSFKEDAANGLGLAVNSYLTRTISLELGVAQADSDVSLDLGGENESVAFGSLRLRPITAALQWHPSSDGTLDWYVGAGAMYLTLGSLEAPDLAAIGIEGVKLDDKFGAMVNAGLAFRITRLMAIDADVKYAPIKTSSRAQFDNGSRSESADIRIAPLLFSAGLRIRF